MIGMKLEKITEEFLEVSIKMRDDLVGNQEHQMLHGGIISSVIDAAGGAMSMVGAYLKLHNKNSDAEEYKRLGNIGTVGLHIDFLRPGVGSDFICTAKLLRAGGKVLSVQMEFRNQNDDLIAVGGGSFLH